jgi:hypothetical protein
MFPCLRRCNLRLMLFDADCLIITINYSTLACDYGILAGDALFNGFVLSIFMTGEWRQH